MGIPLWIWPSSPSLHFLYFFITPFSSPLIFSTDRTTLCFQKVLCPIFYCNHSSLCYLPAILFSVTFHQRPSWPCSSSKRPYESSQTISPSGLSPFPTPLSIPPWLRVTAEGKKESRERDAVCQRDPADGM